MNEDTFNMEVRKFLKRLGVTSQREIEQAVREAVAAGVCVVDPWYSATKRPGVGALYAAVSQVVGDARDLSDLGADPWRTAR